jgi:hypothetical protein
MAFGKLHVASGPGSGVSAQVIGVVLVLWLGVVDLSSWAGWFVTEAGQPPLALLTAVILPVNLFAGAYLSLEPFRRFVRNGDPPLLTTVQSWRILGGVFLVLLSFGLLPAAFALPAGLGDVAIGVTAPFIARALEGPNRFRFSRLFVVWQLLGVLDLVVAVGVGASTRAFPQIAGGSANAELMVVMSQLPLSLIPAFAVPLFVILHFASLAQLRARVPASVVERRVCEAETVLSGARV